MFPPHQSPPTTTQAQMKELMMENDSLSNSREEAINIVKEKEKRLRSMESELIQVSVDFASVSWSLIMCTHHLFLQQ